MLLMWQNKNAIWFLEHVKIIKRITFFMIFSTNDSVLKYVFEIPFDAKSAHGKVMAKYRQVTNHYPDYCRPESHKAYGTHRLSSWQIDNEI